MATLWGFPLAQSGCDFWLLQVTAAVVTCGGLCPGLNDVIQAIVYQLGNYGVLESNIFGIRYGLRGFYDPANRPVTMYQDLVDDIHLRGGTMLVGRPPRVLLKLLSFMRA